MFSIRPLKKEDLSEIIQYQQELYSLNFKEYDFDLMFYIGVMNWYERALKKNEFHSNVLVDNENNVLGFYLYELDGQDCYLMQMFVCDDIRQKKMGLKLIDHYEKEAINQNVHTLSLHVSSINERATNFYLKNGYKIVDEEFDHCGDIRYFMVKG
jgi:ribosomal protein S18 acetylase RimI-like enzyme